MATPSQDITRIFVRNISPTTTQADFEAHLRKHFPNGQITDIKLIPQRRIAYVGYKTPEEAKQAVKKFHRSFIRLSKVSVELAKPIADPSLSRRHPANVSRAPAPAPALAGSDTTGLVERPLSESNQRKRKRGELDEADPKLQEFLDVMQTGKNPAKKNRETESLQPEQPLAVTEAESDNEYEEVPSRKAKPIPHGQSVQTDARVEPGKASQAKALEHAGDGVDLTEPDLMDVDKPITGDSKPVVADDDDWLRQKTNRLLDLVDDIEVSTSAPVPVVAAKSLGSPAQSATRHLDTDSPGVETPEQAASVQQKDDVKDSAIDLVHKSARLFVRNLSYKANDEELHEFFGKFGELEEIHLPANKGTAKSDNQGFAFISYVAADDAVTAFQQADGAIFQGRMLHVIPASAKRQQLDEFTLSKLPLKAQKLKKKTKTGSSFDWNALYVNQDAVIASTAERLGVTKSELLDPTNTDAAVKQALAETSVIQDTKAYFLANGVDLETFKQRQRSDETILVKGLPANTSSEEIRNEFQEYGQILKVLVPPTGTTAIVHFAHASEAKTAFSKLAYRRFKNSILFLERAPKDLFISQAKPVAASAEPTGKEKLSASELLEGNSTEESTESSSSIFVKNVSFNTTTAQLHDAFKHLDGYRSSSVKTKSDPKKPGQVLSMGFGFVAFDSKASAEAAAKSMDGQVLHGHKLVVRTSHRGHDAAEQRRKDDAVKKAAGKSTKIVIKNVPFEASKRDLSSLLSAYGQLRSLRLPKNAQNRSKGYAFCEFVTSRDAENAMALKDTHLLGRKLVLEFAEAEEIDPEEVIAKMAKKTGRQNAKVTLHQLIGGDRKKITLGNEEEGEGEF
ncbi:RNA recognition domain-containing protein [Seiridium cupressi]